MIFASQVTFFTGLKIHDLSLTDFQQKSVLFIVEKYTYFVREGGDRIFPWLRTLVNHVVS